MKTWRIDYWTGIFIRGRECEARLYVEAETSEQAIVVSGLDIEQIIAVHKAGGNNG